MPPHTFEEFVRLRAAIVRAVGMSWGNEEFRAAFLKDPLQAMKDWFQYECPFSLDLTVTPSDEHNKHCFNPSKTGGWVGLDTTITLVLPPAPKADQRAEALGSYNLEHPLFLCMKQP